MSCRSNRAFTIIEMIVVLAIAGIMTAIILSDLPRFRDQSQLELVAQEVAIHIRGAQTYSIGTKAGITETAEDPANSGSLCARSSQELNTLKLDHRPSYGVYFLLNSKNDPNDCEVVRGNQNRAFRYFADLYENSNFDDRFNSGYSDDYKSCASNVTREALKGELYVLPPGYRFWNIVGFRSDSAPILLYNLDVLYKRPYTEATLGGIPAALNKSRQACGGLPGTFNISSRERNLASVDIYIKGPPRDPRCKIVSVHTNGQIAVKPGFMSETTKYCKNEFPP